MGHGPGGIRRHKTEDQKVGLLSFYWSCRCIHNMTVMHEYHTLFLNWKWVDVERGMRVGALVGIGD